MTSTGRLPASAAARADLREALVAYLGLLQAEGVRFQGGVRTALGLLDDDTLDDAEALTRAARAWGGGFRGAGTLGDLVLDRDDPVERRTANEEKSRLEDAVGGAVRRALDSVRG